MPKRADKMIDEKTGLEMVKIASWDGVRYEPVIIVQGAAWERQTDQAGKQEPSLWYNRFNIYRLLGPERTMKAAYTAWREQQGRDLEVKAVSRKWVLMSRKWRWRERAEAWDASQVEVVEDRWLKRRESFREKMWQVASVLIERAEQMSKLPITRVSQEDVVEEGSGLVHRTIIIEPIRWKQKDIADFYETAAKLAAQASGFGQADVDLMLNVDVNQLSTEQLERIMAGEPIQDVVRPRR